MQFKPKCICPYKCLSKIPIMPLPSALYKALSHALAPQLPQIFLSITDPVVSIYRCETERRCRMCPHSHQGGIKTPDIILCPTRHPLTARPLVTCTRELMATEETSVERKHKGYISARSKSTLSHSLGKMEFRGFGLLNPPFQGVHFGFSK